jgi:PHD/YefM family antitoxin component YafN of YafNO toxin-antitoxin module
MRRPRVTQTGSEGTDVTVLVSTDDWRSLQETLQLLLVAGLLESIVEGLGQPLDECSGRIGW